MLGFPVSSEAFPEENKMQTEPKCNLPVCGVFSETEASLPPLPCLDRSLQVGGLGGGCSQAGLGSSAAPLPPRPLQACAWINGQVGEV